MNSANNIAEHVSPFTCILSIEPDNPQSEASRLAYYVHLSSLLLFKIGILCASVFSVIVICNHIQSVSQLIVTITLLC